jgi:hypothetical protein
VERGHPVKFFGAYRPGKGLMVPEEYQVFPGLESRNPLGWAGGVDIMILTPISRIDTFLNVSFGDFSLFSGNQQ